MIRIQTDPRLLLIDWIGHFLFFGGLCLPIYFVVRQASRGLLAGVFSFWMCMTASLFIYEYFGEDMDLTLGCYLVGGWLPGLIYCLPTLVIVEIWRAWRPNPDGYCKKCGRPMLIGQFKCSMGHSSVDPSRGFEVIQSRAELKPVEKD